jgi:hypothetical protein
MGNPRRAARAAAKAKFESLIRQLRSLSRESTAMNELVLFGIVSASILQYPQSYISKLWKDRYSIGIMTTIHRVQQEIDIPMEAAFIFFRREAKEKLNINISFNRDTVSERHCNDLGYLLWCLEQDDD